MDLVDRAFLKALTEIPSVGTACGPMVNLLTKRFGSGYSRTYVPDGFCFFQKNGSTLDDLEAVFVGHLDEVGGCVYGARPEGGYSARFWGTTPEVFAHAELQAMDYLAEDSRGAYPVTGEVVRSGEEAALVIHGDNIQPYRTVWTYRQETTFDEDVIEGKALDPRVTVFAIEEAVRALNDGRIGAMFVMAEECAMDVAKKAVLFLQENAPKLRLIANADVPGLKNIGEGRLDMPAIRIFEGRNFIDPSFGIRVAHLLMEQGVDLHLTAAKSGSQTLLFTPLAPTLSIALPSDGVHLPKYKMSLLGTERCVNLLKAIGTNFLDGAIHTK